MNNPNRAAMRGRLRVRITAFGILVLLSVAVVAFALTYTLIRDRSLQMEETYTTESVQQALFSIEEELYKLEARATDLSSWDDTYAYMDYRAGDFVETNLNEIDFIRYGVNTITLVDTTGHVVFTRTIDLNSQQWLPQPMGEHLGEGSPLLNRPVEEEPLTGLLLVPDYPLLVTAQPILTSSGTGPSHGTLIMGRYLDESIDSQLEGLLQMSLNVGAASPAELPAGFTAANGTNSTIVQPVDAGTVAGYKLLTDIYGNESLLLRVEVPRDIYNESMSNARFLSIGIIVLVAVALVFIVLVFDRQVLRRLAGIDTFVRGYEAIDMSSLRHVAVAGNDELARLSVSLNDMIDRLEESRQQLKITAEENYELSEKNRLQYEEEKRIRQSLQEEIEKRLEFTRALVHELKTPITPIMASVDLLQSQLEDKRLLELTNIVKRSADNLGDRINDLLDLAKAEVNTLQLEISMIEPLLVLEEVGQSMKTVAEKNRQVMEIDLPHSLPVIYTDADRFLRVVESLVSNALKFTPAGGTITLHAREEDNNLIVEIKDTGTGIDAADQEMLFEPYRRRAGDKERMSGLGVGLALSKKFVELQGGHIWVDSEKGKGSTFGFSLPITEHAEKKPGIKESLS